jgi:hypothetical protein
VHAIDLEYVPDEFDLLHAEGALLGVQGDVVLPKSLEQFAQALGEFFLSRSVH